MTFTALCTSKSSFFSTLPSAWLRQSNTAMNESYRGRTGCGLLILWSTLVYEPATEHQPPTYEWSASVRHASSEHKTSSQVSASLAFTKLICGSEKRRGSQSSWFIWITMHKSSYIAFCSLFHKTAWRAGTSAMEGIANNLPQSVAKWGWNGRKRGRGSESDCFRWPYLPVQLLLHHCYIRSVADSDGIYRCAPNVPGRRRSPPALKPGDRGHWLAKQKEHKLKPGIQGG